MTQNFCGHSPLERFPHLLSSPDISPSDFYLFGKIKIQLLGQEILDEISLFEAVSEILNAISPAELKCVSHNWIERVEAVLSAEGDCLAQ
jgi:hypothetical protein